MLRQFLRLAGVAALGAATLAAAQPAFAQPSPVAVTPAEALSQDDFLLLQLTVRHFRLETDVRGYRIGNGVCLDLGDTIQALDLPIRLDKKSRRATGWLFSEDQKFTLDRDSNTVQTMNMGSAPLAGEITDTPEGWCVDTRALSRWFGITFKPDLFNARIILQGADDLPFLKALERRSRAAQLSQQKPDFDLADYRRADTAYRVWRTPSVDVTINATATAGGGNTGTSATAELYAAGEALGASYSARLSTDQQLVPAALRVTAFRQDPDGGLLGPLHATRVAAGDIQTDPGRLTLASAIGRGLYVGNRPLGQDSRFSTTDLYGVLPSGWDAELYRNGQLIGYQSASTNGRYAFTDIELYYGNNDLEVVLYGPQGQVRRERFSYPIGQANVEPGKTYYWANIVQPNTDLITLRSLDTPVESHWRYGMGFEHGFDRRTSMMLAASGDYLAGKRRDFLEGSLTRTFGRMQVELGGAHELRAGGAVRLAAIGRVANVSLGADFTKVIGTYVSEAITSQFDYRASFNASTSLKLGSVALPVQLAIGRARLVNGTMVTQLAANASLSVRGLAITASLDHGLVDDPTTPEDESQTQARLLLSTRQAGFRLRGGIDAALSGSQRGVQTVQFAAERMLGQGIGSADLRYSVQTGQTDATLSYARQFKSFGLRGEVGAGSAGIWHLGLSLNFSIGPDPVYGGVRVSEQRLARQGQAKVTVFRDENGDGHWEPGEKLLNGVTITAGLRGTDAKTNGEGEALVDNLTPYRPILIGVDTSTLEDPFLAPSEKGVVIVPRPGVPSEVMLAVTASGEIEGTVLSPAGIVQAGITLELVDAHGSVVATTLSEFDGFFLFDKVPYGQYRVRVAASTAKALQVRAELDEAVVIKSGADVGRLGKIRLRAAPQLIAANP